jgi:hypothetical protein
MHGTSACVVWGARILRVVIVAAALSSASAGAALLTYRWEQSGCQGNACGADISGSWVFDAAAVQRGTATFVAVPQAFPQIDPHEVDSFTFTIGAFSVKGVPFGPLTWTNANAIGGQADRLLGTYQATFSADRRTIAHLSQSTATGLFDSPDTVGFDLAPTNPSISVGVQPTAIFFRENTGSEPQVDGIPVTAQATLTGAWVLENGTPVPEPAVSRLLLAGLFAFAAGVLTRRRKAKPN